MMRMRMALLTLVVVACGGSGNAKASPSTPRAPAAPPPRAPAAPQLNRPVTGRIHEVRMVLTDDGQYEFQPRTIDIHVGDAIRWISVSGGPHNVSFDPESIPAGAAAILNAAMKDRIGNLEGPFLADSNATYQITFAGVPPGTYDYYCLPHQPLGMQGEIRITK